MTDLSAIDLSTVGEMIRKEPDKVLAALEIPPYSTMYSDEEKEKIREALGIRSCVSCLVIAFILDVLLPPPFRPPLMLVVCFLSRACP